jgi:hypothetical protein
VREMSSDVRPVYGAPQRSAEFFEDLDEKCKLKVLIIALKVWMPDPDLSFRQFCGDALHT